MEKMMKCPVCTDANLLMTERLGIEIDYCPQCRGVWLDRGELDKIIERSAREVAPSAAAPVMQVQAQPAAQQFSNHQGYHDKGHNDHHGYRGKQSFWKDLFD